MGALFELTYLPFSLQHLVEKVILYLQVIADNTSQFLA